MFVFFLFFLYRYKQRFWVAFKTYVKILLRLIENKFCTFCFAINKPFEGLLFLKPFKFLFSPCSYSLKTSLLNKCFKKKKKRLFRTTCVTLYIVSVLINNV